MTIATARRWEPLTSTGMVFFATQTTEAERRRAGEQRKSTMLAATLRKFERRAMLIWERDGIGHAHGASAGGLTGDAVVKGDRPQIGGFPFHIQKERDP